MKATPFSVPAFDAEWDDLRNRVGNTRWTPDISFDDQYRGIHVDQVRELAEEWVSTFDWRSARERLNDLPHFMIEIDGQPLHFIHIESAREDARPLILLHGFPDSFVGFMPILEKLSDPQDDNASAFHLVNPSHPGYVFSNPLRGAMTSKGIASLYAKLMRELGYDSYFVQGGDFGAMIGPDMGREDPEHVRGVHVNAASFGFIPFGEVSEEEQEEFTDIEKQRYEHLQNYNNDLNWYFDPQSKRPLTIGYGLSDSPVGLLSWIATLVNDFSGPKIDLLADVENRELFFTNLTLWWMTNSFTTAANLYFDSMHDQSGWPYNSGVPTGVASFDHDASMRRFSEEMNTIVHWTDFEFGGHFAAMDSPDALVSDLKAFVAKIDS